MDWVLLDNQKRKDCPDSIIDVQVKRFPREYERQQQMLLLYLIWKYFDIRDHLQSIYYCHFGGKAAPAYVAAQETNHSYRFLTALVFRLQTMPDLFHHLGDNDREFLQLSMLLAADISRANFVGYRKASELYA